MTGRKFALGYGVAALVFACVVLVVAGTNSQMFTTPPLSRDALIEKIKAATFSVETRLWVAVVPAEGWEERWDAFAKETGAVKMGLVPSSYGTVLIFRIEGHGASAWFFGKRQMAETPWFTAYAMTNAHLFDESSLLTELKSAASYDAVVTDVVDTLLQVCPNFTTLHQAPSCTNENVEVGMIDTNLDVAVIEVQYIDASAYEAVVTLPLGDGTNLPAGTDVITVGAALSIPDIVADGRTLPIQAPYLNIDGWRHCVPYDMNSVGGFSGSPVVDAKTGHVVGLHRGGLRDPRGSGRSIGIFIPMAYIKAVLFTNGYPVTSITL